MNISYNWLKEFIQITESPEEIGEVLTQTGLEVEHVNSVEKIKGGLEGLVIGEVITCEPHPNADKLNKTTVDIGSGELLNIVCGAPNVAAGQKVIVATLNTTIYPNTGEPFTIKKAKIRGEESRGMICAEDEIGLGSAHDGIIILDTDKENGTPAKEIFDTGADFVFEIGLTPNRGDATSHMGTARDLKAYYKRDISFPSYLKPEIKEERPIKITVENHEACPRYSGVTIRGLKISNSPDWIQQKLKAVGLNPINNVVDITNYVMMALGQPMHAFDADAVGDEIIVKTLPEGTTFKTLDEVERKLSERDLMICNNKEGMCLAGVFGGIDSGIKEGTTDIFLESAYFSADWVRNTATRHSISTDSSFRFERGADPEMTLVGLQWAASLIIDIAGGFLASDFIDIYPNPIKPCIIESNYQNICALIGEPIPNARIKEILEWLDIKVTDSEENNFIAIVPPYRSEVTREADLVEEVLRIYGFNNISLDDFSSTGFLAHFKEKEPHNLQEKITTFLAGVGFNEIQTNSLTSPEYFKAIPLGQGQPVEILNKSSEELGIMKTSPIYTALESVVYNINRKKKNLRFFEFSKSYLLEGEKYKEKELLTLYLTGNTKDESWRNTSNPVEFHDLSSVITALTDYLNLEYSKVSLLEDETLQYGLALQANNKVIGKVGRLNNKIEGHYDLKQPVFYAELDWNACVRHAKLELNFKSISKYPEVRRDLSLVIDKSITYTEIEKIAQKSERKLLTRSNVFSVYEGDKIEKGKKSYAISFYLQDEEKTLTDKTIDKTMNRLINAFEREAGAVIRK
ncbi:MAG: phenylalanyl-tRNA synthetase beta chain [Cyclobacteriaceae bacterium]|jgi:phenylalanyl-tRNA synthetase beta chain